MESNERKEISYMNKKMLVILSTVIFAIKKRSMRQMRKFYDERYIFQNYMYFLDVGRLKTTINRDRQIKSVYLRIYYYCTYYDL